jgi:hypothetical protein
LTSTPFAAVSGVETTAAARIAREAQRITGLLKFDIVSLPERGQEACPDTGNEIPYGLLKR